MKNIPFLLLFIWPFYLFAQAITDPSIDIQPSENLGISFELVAIIPDAPSGQGAPRLNMLKESPDGSGRLFVIDQYGYMYVINSQGEESLYLNVRSNIAGFEYNGGQTGLTSFAFHPNYAENGKFYTVSSVLPNSGTPDFLAKRPIDPSDGSGLRTPEIHDVIIEWTASNPLAVSFTGSSREILRIEQPYLDHNTGEVAFNPNARVGDADYGMLYVAVADGGNVFPITDADPENNGQDLQTILGTIIRIDPLGTNSQNGAYGIPSDNPWALTDGLELDEIWTYGHRNHHRLSWDLRGDQAMYAFEMGQSMIEEINRITPSGNYGWGIREGTFWLKDELNEAELFPIPSDEVVGTFEYPVFQYDHPPTSTRSSGAIAGGFVYRGANIPSLYGKIIFADFTNEAHHGGVYYGNIIGLDDLAYGEAADVHYLDVYRSTGSLSSLASVITPGSSRTDTRVGQDISGNLYFLNKRNGRVYRMIASPFEPSFEVTIDKSIVGVEGESVDLTVSAENESFSWELEIDGPFVSTSDSLSNIGSKVLTLEVSPSNDGNREALIVVAGKRIILSQVGSTEWAQIFPNGELLFQNILETDAMGIIHIEAWPWVYSFALDRWVFISPELDNTGAIPIYFPR